MTRRRIGMGIAGLAVVLLAAWWFGLRRDHAPPPATAAVTPNVALATVRAGDFTSTVEAQGRVGPPAGSSAKVAFAEAGVVAQIDVHVGESVSAGTPLAVLDRRALGAALAQAQADAAAAASQYGGGGVPQAAVSSAAAKAALAASRLQTLERGGPAAQSDEIAARQTLRQAELKVQSDRAAVARDQTLFAAGVIAAKDLDAARMQLAADLSDQQTAQAKVSASVVGYQASLSQARADLAAAKSDLRTAKAQGQVLGAQSSSARARVQAAQVAYDQGTLRAPSDGVVAAVFKHPGEYVDPSVAVVEVGPGSVDAVTLTVPANTAARIGVGDPVQLVLQNSGAGSRGRVSAVVPAVDPTTQSATVTVDGAHLGVPGDAVSARILTGHLHGLLVPSSAIVQDPQTGQSLVFVRQPDGTFDSRTVAVRASDRRTTLVGSGLASGERIAATGAYELLAPSGG